MTAPATGFVAVRGRRFTPAAVRFLLDREIDRPVTGFDAVDGRGHFTEAAKLAIRPPTVGQEFTTLSPLDFRAVDEYGRFTREMVRWFEEREA